MKKYKLIIVLFITAVFHSSAEQIGTFRLDHLSLSDGLVNSSVSKIVQDSNGFMWFGTLSGLSKYDGYSFKTYLNNPFDNNSIPHNLIQTMYIDNNDILWLGTYNGLCRFDINQNTFENYPSSNNVDDSLSNDVVVAIERDSIGQLWVGTLNGLNLFDEESGSFKRFYNDPENPDSLPNNTVRTIFNDANDNLWIGTYGGLSLWNKNTESFINFLPDENDPHSIPSVYVMNIIQSPVNDDVIILGTWGGGIAEFNTKTKTAVRFEIPDMVAYTMLPDEENRVWIGTWGAGLVILSLEDGNYDHFIQGSSSDLSHNIVYSLYQDQSGVVWLGTKGGGIDKYVDWKNQYQFFTNDENDFESIPFGEIRVAYEDSKNRFWFGVIGSGLSRYDEEKKSFINYTHDEENENSLSNSIINAIFEDSSNNVWIGTNNGLNRYIEDSDSFERIYSGEEGASLPENLIYTIAEDQEKNLWFGSYTRGISVLEYKTGKYRFYRHDEKDPASISDNLIRSMTVDSSGKIWIATNKGLNLYIPETDSFKSYLHKIDDRNSISSNDIRKIFEDSKGDLWIATNGGGVNLYNKEFDNFSFISTLDGLLNNSVVGIEENADGNLLFITQTGISIYNRNEKSFTVIDEKTGLLSSELTSGYLKASDGSFYFGSNKGITHIPVFEDQYFTYTPKIHIINLSVLGIPYDNHGKSIWDSGEIALKHKENILSFEFVLTDYSSEGQNQFAYKMEGVDSDWVYSGVRNFARYTELDPGNYTFRVIGADSRNNWNNVGTFINIIIHPPIWQSPFAIIVYILLVILMIFLLILKIKSKEKETAAQIEKQKALNIELENRVRKRTAEIEEAREIAENATKAKSLFLANISHELRTPLNAVVGFSALLDENDYSPEKKHIINSIKAAGKSLSTLINDLLDLSKMEAGKMSISYSPVNLSSVLFEIKHIFDLRIKEKDIKFNIIEDLNLPNDIMFDETRFRQILINLTGNAIKFTESGNITISVSKIDKGKSGLIDLKVSVSDTGCGINKKEKEKIFNFFWQSEKKDLKKMKGTGLGLSITKNLVTLMNGEISLESQINKGTVFHIIFHDITVLAQRKKKLASSNPDLFEKIRFTGVKALVVDDVEDNRNLLIEIMNQVDVETLWAENGREAVISAKKNHPDIIFMDLQMPVLDGYSASKLIQNERTTANIPIVAVTASIESQIDNEIRMEKSIFSDYISKPYSLNRVINVLKKVLNHTSYIIEVEDSSKKISNRVDTIINKKNLLLKMDAFLEEWQSLKPTGRMSILENFSNRLIVVSRMHKARDLTAYAETLLSYVRLFDLSRLEEQLAIFPEMVKKIKN